MNRKVISQETTRHVRCNLRAKVPQNEIAATRNNKKVNPARSNKLAADKMVGYSQEKKQEGVLC